METITVYATSGLLAIFAVSAAYLGWRVLKIKSSGKNRFNVTISK